MDCSLPGSSVHGILQARTLEWVAISFSREFSWPRDWTQVSCIGGRCFNLWASREILLGIANRMWRAFKSENNALPITLNTFRKLFRSLISWNLVQLQFSCLTSLNIRFISEQNGLICQYCYTLARMAWWIRNMGSAVKQTELHPYCTIDSLCCHCCLVAKSFPTLCNPMDCSPPNSSAHRTSQARIQERVSISFSRASSQHRDWTHISCSGRHILYCWATREVPIFCDHSSKPGFFPLLLRHNGIEI